MKKYLLLFSALFIIAFSSKAQDTLYMYQSGILVMKRAVSAIDSITFKSAAPSDMVTDFDGNVYSTVKIGTLTWMAGNLRTSHYNDGSPIDYVPDNNDWMDLTQGAFTWYNNDSAAYEIPYGKMYNWYAVETEKLCPAGWHVANEDEWLYLGSFLEGSEIAGGKLKATGTAENGDGLWIAPNTGATNSTGFNGLPGGRRYSNGAFEQMGIKGVWWSSTDTPGYSFSWGLENINERLNGASYDVKNGLSVRCVKD